MRTSRVGSRLTRMRYDVAPPRSSPCTVCEGQYCKSEEAALWRAKSTAPRMLAVVLLLALLVASSPAKSQRLQFSWSPSTYIGTTNAAPGDTLKVYILGTAPDASLDGEFLCSLQGRIWVSECLQLTRISLGPDGSVAAPKPPYPTPLNEIFRANFDGCQQFHSPELFAVLEVAVLPCELPQGSVVFLPFFLETPPVAPLSDTCEPIRFCQGFPLPVDWALVDISPVATASRTWSAVKALYGR